ncbi:MAG: TauD/TfdA family dioxygenase [Okeania sp. SIO2F4]|uniref:TauD/TfdA family dioxygenase n=1 Tax=Okeania sp. SIO2F4 TaxID=2607790 RepID=UPI00142B1772|nr:TauD/TfdA family dioxygenase [Okeania sp. SIO2F4]NES02875.1 TauD/TfdA family dioxygenase [Okeania sp. SIO2F4]
MLKNTKIEIQPFSENVGRKIIKTENTSLLEIDKEEIINLFKSYGFLLFRGFETNVNTFAEFSNSLSKDFMDYTGGVINRRIINEDGTILTVNDFKDEMELHGEMYYINKPPQIVWFFCANPPLKDGETTVCDGQQFFHELSSSTKDLLSRKKLKISGNFKKEYWQKKYKTNDVNVVKEICNSQGKEVQVNEDESIYFKFICSAIHNSRTEQDDVFINSLLRLKKVNPKSVCFDDDSEITDEIMSELNEIAEKITIEINWQKGDILMIDNTRIMHGRRAFSDDRRDIYIRLCFPAFPF